MPPNSSNIILELLAKSVAKLEGQRKKTVEDNIAIVEPDKLLKKPKLQVDDIKSKTNPRRKYSNEDLVKAVVYNHLKEVAPQLAKQFNTEQTFKKTELNLRDIVRPWKRSQQLKENLLDKCSKKKNRKIGFATRFTPDEDHTIQDHIEKAGEGKVDVEALATHLNRAKGSIWCRIKLLKKTGGGKTTRKRFTLVEDQTLIEMLIIPRLTREKLSEIKLVSHQTAEMAHQLDKHETGVRNRWHVNLQPLLLQYYAGTLNLRVERMLANHLNETYENISDIDWSRVAVRQEFAGQTEISLKLLFSKLGYNSNTKFNKVRTEVTLQQIADYSENVYGEGAQGKAKEASSSKLEHQEKVIAFFESKVKELGIMDFL